ncbi:MAG: hypothetical protein KAI81_07985 [Candidatus Marinimicrobia bacterium]|nr:hypothetical protein [Candidatus Neomarinimicrobiota bacterium]
MNIKDATFFTLQDVVRERNLKPGSARVWCNRQVKRGLILRIKNALYVDAMKEKYLSREERYFIGNHIQVPSYISLSTALFYYDLTNQMYRNRIESVAQKRSIQYTVGEWEYQYYTIKSDYYTSFRKENGIFIATAEKALADIIYLVSLGKYALDFSALEWDKINLEALNTVLENFPDHTRRWWNRHGSVQAARNF